MRLGTPDRVPLMCQLALGHYFLNTGLDAIDIWHSTEHFGDALIQLQRRYGFDGILINLPGRDPNWRSDIRTIDRTRSSPVERATISTPARMNASRRAASRRSAASRNRARKARSLVST